MPQKIAALGAINRMRHTPMTLAAWLARLLDQQEVLITVTDVSFLPHGQT